MRLFAPALTASLFAFGAAAHADTFAFNFNVPGTSSVGFANGLSGSGTITATANGDGSFTGTSLTGPGLAALVAPNTFAHNDNQLFPTQAGQLDFGGLAFTDVVGDTADIFFDSTTTSYFANIELARGNSVLQSATFALSPVSPTPEPSSLALLGTGILGIASFCRRRLA